MVKAFVLGKFIKYRQTQSRLLCSWECCGDVCKEEGVWGSFCTSGYEYSWEKEYWTLFLSFRACERPRMNLTFLYTFLLCKFRKNAPCSVCNPGFLRLQPHRITMFLNKPLVSQLRRLHDYKDTQLKYFLTPWRKLRKPTAQYLFPWTSHTDRTSHMYIWVLKSSPEDFIEKNASRERVVFLSAQN